MMPNKSHIVKFLIALMAICISSCKEKRDEIRFSEGIDREGCKKIEFMRLDRDLSNIDPVSTSEGILKLCEKYPALSDSSIGFMEFYTERVFCVGEPSSMEASLGINQIIRDKHFKNILHTCDSVFSDMSEIEEQLSYAFAILRHHLPGITLPQRYIAYVSGFNYNILLTQDDLAVALEFFLGSDYKFYKEVATLYDYMRPNCRPGRLCPAAIECIVTTEFPLENAAPCLLEKMIYIAKVAYVTSAALPDCDIKDILGFTKEQIEWCEANEAQMWRCVAENKHLFSTDRLTVSKYTEPGPFTAFFPSDSPGRAIIYSAYKIVSGYMSRNKDVTLEGLLTNTDFQSILEKSGYNPK